jgi:hypothetical protein
MSLRIVLTKSCLYEKLEGQSSEPRLIKRTQLERSASLALYVGEECKNKHFHHLQSVMMGNSRLVGSLDISCAEAEQDGLQKLYTQPRAVYSAMLLSRPLTQGEVLQQIESLPSKTLDSPYFSLVHSFAGAQVPKYPRLQFRASVTTLGLAGAHARRFAPRVRLAL